MIGNIMKDMLDRELKENDLVLGMVISRDSDGMRHGVFNGTSVHWVRRSYIRTSTINNMYLVENPTAKELEIKQDILNRVEKARKEKEAQELAKNLMTKIPQKDLVQGKLYETDNGHIFTYLGKGTVFNSYSGESKYGYIYVSIYYT
jgi:hypothetical protein